MIKSRKRAEQRDPAATKEHKQQKGYLFAGLMLLAGIAVALISAGVHRSKDGQPVLASGPDYATDHLMMWNGASMPSPYSFLYSRTSILVDSVRYVQVPEITPGDHDVALLIQLKDGTTRTEEAVLTVKDAVMHMEVGTVETPAQLLGKGFEDAVITPAPENFPEIGSYPVTVTFKGTSMPFTLVVEDTTAPVAVFYQNLTFYKNQELTVSDFVESCTDMSEVEYHFSDTPSTINEGVHTIQMIVTDTAGNSQTYDLEYLVSGDGEAPLIQGVGKLQTVAGVPIDYMRGIKAIDYTDGVVDVKAVEPPGFSITKPGTYEITYTAVDSAGNVGEEKAEFVVLAAGSDVSVLTQDDVMRMGDYIIGELSKTNQQIDQKAFARAIFDYVQSHMTYVNGNNNEDWTSGAVAALTLGYGDSASYYALSRLLLTCAGYDNMMVERQSEEEIGASEEDKAKIVKWYAPHFWNLVRVNGAWYHFDTSPYYGGTDFFLWTDTQIDYFSALNGNCYERDKSLYPLTPS
ncbi:MAG: transglutaminase domain-containing protein [Oscillospiraceae bacterium]|nr:transglutaminase domain-containing protein [Oscillospiraceae bacterium]